MYRSIQSCAVTALLICLAACTSSGPTETSSAAAPDPVAELHESLMVLDSHLDTPALLVRPGFNILQRYSPSYDYSQVDYPRMLEGGLDGGFWVIYSPQGPLTTEAYQRSRDTAILRALAIHKMVAGNPEKFSLATKSPHAARIHSVDKKVVYLSIENAYPLGEDLSLLKTFYDLGVRMVGPVHFRNNQFGDSSTDPDGQQWQGLSPLGYELVKEANRLGMMLDGSHGHDDLVRDMIAASATPIVLSHSGATEIYGHPRNVPDDILLKLKETGGVIQMNAFSAYLTRLPETPERRDAYRALQAEFSQIKNPTLEQRNVYLAKRREIDAQFPKPLATFEDFMDHFIYVLNLIGPDHVGVGADWDGGGGVRGMEDITGFPKITARLLAEGYTEEDLKKIWGGNLIRVLAEVEAYAAEQ